jgi:pimeloyl-ACP methyl ester carboxylesterase
MLARVGTKGETMTGPGPHSCYIRCLGREVHYTEWGSPDAPPVVMWHGLARTGRDFDDIAAALADRYRVLCPDTIGRGLSEWSPEPDAEYCFAHYARLAKDLVDQLGIARLRWVGTSMGAALGIAVAGGPLRERISHLVLNDIAPTMPEAARARIASYIGNPPDFASMTELERYYRTLYVTFGAHTDAQWRRMAETGMRRLPNGRVTTHHDPAIARQLVVHPGDFEQWPAYDAITARTLLLRGESSALVSPEIAEAMTRRGPRAAVVQVPGCGHAPGLNVTAQIEVVARSLAE